MYWQANQNLDEYTVCQGYPAIMVRERKIL